MSNFFKKCSKYKFWPGDVFIIPPSSGALALHAQIISLEKLRVFQRAESEGMNNFYVQ